MKANEVLDILKISRPTLTKYVQNGTIKGNLKENGQYEYDTESVMNYVKSNHTESGETVIYARVNSEKYREQLKEQINYVESYSKNNGIKINRTIYDISNGYTFSRKNLQQLIKDVCSYNITNIVIKNKNILSIISYDMLEDLFKSYNCNITIANEYENADIMEDFIDVMSTTIKMIPSTKINKQIHLMQQLLQNEIEY